VQLSHKIVGLDLAPTSKNVRNHWFILCRSCRHGVIAWHVSRNCSSLWCELRGQQSIKKVQSCCKTFVRYY